MCLQACQRGMVWSRGRLQSTLTGFVFLLQMTQLAQAVVKVLYPEAGTVMWEHFMQLLRSVEGQ
jgi:hypothetical protein